MTPNEYKAIKRSERSYESIRAVLVVAGIVAFVVALYYLEL